jgi:hypothetical protein
METHPQIFILSSLRIHSLQCFQERLHLKKLVRSSGMINQNNFSYGYSILSKQLRQANNWLVENVGCFLRDTTTGKQICTSLSML